MVKGGKNAVGIDISRFASLFLPMTTVLNPSVNFWADGLLPLNDSLSEYFFLFPILETWWNKISVIPTFYRFPKDFQNPIRFDIFDQGHRRILLIEGFPCKSHWWPVPSVCLARISAVRLRLSLQNLFIFASENHSPARPRFTNLAWTWRKNISPHVFVLCFRLLFLKSKGFLIVILVVLFKLFTSSLIQSDYSIFECSLLGFLKFIMEQRWCIFRGVL